MSKTVKIVLIIVAILVVVGGIFLLRGSSENNNNVEQNIASQEENTAINENESVEPENTSTNLVNTEELEKIIDKSYEGLAQDLLPLVETTQVDVSDKDTVAMLTGLEDGKELEALVISQPLMSSQAYSFVIAKVKSGVDANKVAQKMSEQVDMRRWVCVEAEKLYATNSEDIVCLIMGDTERADAVYSNFKKTVEKVGKEYEKTAEVSELPEDMY